MRNLMAILLLLGTMTSLAGETQNPMQQEVEYLITQLESSSCKFKRNGTWHSASEASAHIRKKYTYLQNKHQLSTTESFIQQAGAKSSVTGIPYQVQCGNAPAIKSDAWFISQLNAYRENRE